MTDKAAAKATLQSKAEWEPPHPGCTGCGRQPGPWFAPSKEWNLVIGGPDATDDPGGMLCASCYLGLAFQVFPRAGFEVRMMPI